MFTSPGIMKKLMRNAIGIVLGVLLFTACVSNTPERYGKAVSYELNEPLEFEDFTLTCIKMGQQPDLCHGTMSSFRRFQIVFDNQTNEFNYVAGCLVWPVAIDQNEKVYCIHVEPPGCTVSKNRILVEVKEISKYYGPSEKQLTPEEELLELQRKYVDFLNNPPVYSSAEEAERIIMADWYNKDATYALKYYAFMQMYEDQFNTNSVSVEKDGQ